MFALILPNAGGGVFWKPYYDIISTSNDEAAMQCSNGNNVMCIILEKLYTVMCLLQTGDERK
jgi:hypothetical protein